MIDFLEIGDFLDPTACDALRAELRVASGAAASLLSGEVRDGQTVVVDANDDLSGLTVGSASWTSASPPCASWR